MKHKFAAQLTTVRELVKQDFPGTLRELKAMGWPAVQISRLWGWDAREIAAVLQETGLQVAGMHVALDRLIDELDKVLEEAVLFNTKDIVLKGLPGKTHNPSDFVSARFLLNELARKLAPQGYRISYHNHDFELQTNIEGKSALEFLLEPTEDNLLLAEIDVYWVKKGGRDTVEFLKPYAHRMPIIHLKDMTNDEAQTFAEIGTGTIDFEPILRWGEQSGIEWYAVEQDKCPGHPMDSMQISLDNLNRLADRIQKQGHAV
ncbi:sugar phosphate isomerase/epimerase family protein [Paenibacillus cremeus]|uniref:TIM barrel protein n=1 Tax=Paenibacillus cremeus TaxID=2163881 RepID=A0A559KBI5_9BACL|nr:sugar phosphate isomerase/epimerase [Paenibacillus cremeus]TVY09459.1 TIM barrel protein [Paenibacillus cremeus]